VADSQIAALAMAVYFQGMNWTRTSPGHGHA
jgi:thymidine phosphorylase